MTVTEFVAARLDELMNAALDASSGDTPEHWEWVCSECDAVFDVPEAVAAGLYLLAHCGDWRTGQRSKETYPAKGGGVLPHFVVETAEPVTPADAHHMMIHDPDHTVRMVSALRHLMELLAETAKSYPATAEVLCLAVAAIWSDHPDFPKGSKR